MGINDNIQEDINALAIRPAVVMSLRHGLDVSPCIRLYSKGFHKFSSNFSSNGKHSEPFSAVCDGHPEAQS